MAKRPRVQKTKAQVLEQLKHNVDFQKKMHFVREQFYPALIRVGESIEDTQHFLAGFNNALMEQFLGFMKEKKFAELKLDERIIDTNGKYKETLELFAEKSVFDAKDLIEGMKNEIGLFIQDENKNRPLSDLKTKWIDQI